MRLWQSIKEKRMGKNRTPQDNSFNCAKIYSRAETILYTVSFLFSIFQHFTSCMPENYFLIITGLILIFLLCLKRLKVRSLDKANDARRNFFFDNAFNNNRIPHENKTYYDNEDLPGGLKKALANVHENTLFTSKITGQMLVVYGMLSFFIITIFLASIFINGLDEANAILLGFILSGGIVTETLNLYSLYDGTSEALSRANFICDSFNKTGKISLCTADIIELLLRYEALTCGNEIVLSETIYRKMNASITKEWINLKSNYKIYN